MKINLNLVKIISNYIMKIYNKNYNFHYKTQKYKLEDIIIGIIYVLKTGISWHDYNYNSISGLTLYYHYTRFSKSNIFSKIYTLILNKYLSNNKNTKLNRNFS